MYASLSEIPAGSPALRVLFVALSLAVVGSIVAAVAWSAARAGLGARTAGRQGTVAAVVAVLWLALTGGLASAGMLRFDPAPRTMVVLFPIVIGGAIALALSPIGRRFAAVLPIGALVGFQGYRVGVELLMHRAYTEGLMPVQMSYSGRNYDIVTGITALVLGASLAMGRTSRRLVFAWNTLGVALLLNILGVAVLSAPTPLRVFSNEPSNVWITRAPWVWLPAVLVFAAILGHAVVYRWLWIESRDTVRAGARVAPAVSLAALLVLHGCADARSSRITAPDDAIAPQLRDMVMGTKTMGPHADTVLATMHEPLAVMLVDRGGVPVRGVTVTWEVIGDGSVSAREMPTDAGGESIVSFTFGRRAGNYVVRASVHGVEGSPIDFAPTAHPGNAVSLVKVKGDSLLVAAGEKVVHTVGAFDAYGNPVHGVFVRWAGVDGGEITPAQTTTNKQGRAEATFTTVGMAGFQRVLATATSIADSPAVTFTTRVAGR